MRIKARASRTIRYSSSLTIVMIGTIALALVCGCAQAERAPAKGAAAVTYDEAVALLGSDSTMCRGAAALAQLDDARALLPLGAAYRRRSEGSKQCLIEALGAIGRADRILAAYAKAAPAERATLLVVGYLSPSDELLPLAEQGLADADADVRWQARRMISNWKNTPAWRGVVCRALGSADKQTRAQALGLLERIRGAEVDAALAAQAAREDDPALHKRFADTLQKRATSGRAQ